MMKNCIFHIPFKINVENPSGSQIRPVKMLNAFHKKGYNVDIVMGSVLERRDAINNIKNKIKLGKKYDFVYSESSTYPTLRTESTYRLSSLYIDFRFLKFCKKNNIKIGLFYRDIYWRFPIYNKSKKIKNNIFKTLYYYDLLQYRKILDILYVPSLELYEHLPLKFRCEILELPPGVNTNDKIYKKNNYPKERLNIFYVGGIGELYELSLLMQIVNELDFLDCTICCRKNEWSLEKYRYEKYLNSRIDIIHVSGEELNYYYDKSDILSLFFEPHEYRDIAIPFKLFEYLGRLRPILATNTNPADNFIKVNNIGWNVEYNYNILKEQIFHIYNNQHEIIAKSDNMKNIIENHTWESRAEKVISDLLK